MRAQASALAVAPHAHRIPGVIEPDTQCCITRTTSPRDGFLDLPGTRYQSPITSVSAQPRAIRWLLIALGVLILPYLDAVRKVFSDAPDEHEDMIPEDIGFEPYDSAFKGHQKH
jgi:hypothetical protein